ncbi:MAG: hypothetical protein QOE01_257, partial [Actinomycetota bacterium]|nr:hypothetical protein [Actinomycetota bacterium]
MACARCGSDNEPGARFCTECGEPLVAVCPSCSAANRPGAKFCASCGTALSAITVPTEQPVSSVGMSSAAQRRVVTVLFADLVGFTTISQHRDAEEVRDLLTRYFDTARTILERHGGVVEKFIGDAVMAVWGSEVAHEDDAERAVRAAMELLESMTALGGDLGVDLAARAGVLTGEAAVSVGAQTQSLVAGDLVNTASRLQSAAEPGTVLVGESTYQSASEAITFEPLGEISVKGRDEPVATWRALRVVGERGGGGRPGRPEPPFAGRTEELRLVKELLHVTARERRARLVSLTGIGGIGKSRLVWEFRKYVDGLTDNVFWHQGRCPAYGEGVTFWALGEMVRLRAGIAESDEPSEARRKLTAMLEDHFSDEEERHWAEPRIAHLLGLADAPQGNREELFSAWRTLFERIAERGVTALVFEDLHWADSGLLDFIESMLEWSRSSAIIVVTLARQELLDRRPTWGAGQRSFSALHLEPLDDGAMTELVTGFVTGLSDADAGRIVTRSEGVPLYAVETIRMLADNGGLTVKGTSYDVAGDLGELDVPSTLHALIAARLDVLPADDRELLRDAAVLGVSFTVDALATVRAEPAEGIEPRLRDLVRREFLAQDSDPRSPERGQYTFLQGLIREVAYGTLSKADRRRKHLAVARYCASLEDDELAGVVASHYVEALRATPEGPEADELVSSVRASVTRAADRALSLGSPEQALSYLEQALDLTPERERAPLLELAGEAARRVGALERGIGYFDAAAELHRVAGDGVGAARVAAALSLPLVTIDRRPEALRRLEQARDQLPADADDPTRAELFIALSESVRYAGDAEQALDYVETALRAAERYQSLALLARAITQKSGTLFDLGRHREALILARGALGLATETGSRESRALALLTVSVQLAEHGPRESYEAGIEARAAARLAGIRPLEYLIAANTIEAAVELGRFSDADRLIDEYLPRVPDEFLKAGMWFSAAVLAAYRGDHTAAAAHMAQVQGRDQIEDRMFSEQTWHLRVSSLVRLLRGDAAGSYGDARRSVVMEPTGM